MVQGKARPPSKFRGNIVNLEGWIIQMEDDITITQTRNLVQRLAYIDLCTEGDVFECWKSNKDRLNAVREV